MWSLLYTPLSITSLLVFISISDIILFISSSDLPEVNLSILSDISVLNSNETISTSAVPLNVSNNFTLNSILG